MVDVDDPRLDTVLIIGGVRFLFSHFLVKSKISMTSCKPNAEYYIKEYLHPFCHLCGQLCTGNILRGFPPSQRSDLEDQLAATSKTRRRVPTCFVHLSYGSHYKQKLGLSSGILVCWTHLEPDGDGGLETNENLLISSVEIGVMLPQRVRERKPTFPAHAE